VLFEWLNFHATKAELSAVDSELLCGVQGKITACCSVQIVCNKDWRLTNARLCLLPSTRTFLSFVTGQDWVMNLIICVSLLRSKERIRQIMNAK
jgi:hypothetical protein